MSHDPANQSEYPKFRIVAHPKPGVVSNAPSPNMLAHAECHTRRSGVRWRDGRREGPWWKGYIPLPICVGLVGLGYYVVSELVTFEIPLLVAAVMQALSFIIIIFAIAHTYWWPRRELKIDDNRIYFAIGLSRTTIPWSAVQQMSLVELTQSTRPAARSKTQWYLRLELSTSESAGSARFPSFDAHARTESPVPDNIFAFSVAAAWWGRSRRSRTATGRASADD